MQRRKFLASSMAASAAALSQPGFGAGQTPASGRLYYELRRYCLITGPQMPRLTEAYLADAFIPAVNRLGVKPVGAFKLDVGPDTPATYVLLPHTSVETLVNLKAKLHEDEEYLRAAAPFRDAAADRPAFVRIESQILHAFDSFPAVHLPTAGKGQRIFQMRTYESPTPRTHDLKVEMFGKGELDIFHNVGFEPVFFGDALVGPRLPNLTYMLTFKDQTDLTVKWDRFRADPAWKKLSTNERYGTEALVSNITNLYLTPTPYSQI